MLLTAVLLFAPSLSAGAGRTAPFPGAKYSSNNLINNYCNTRGGWGIVPRWSNATGIGAATAAVKSTSCPAALGGVSGGLVQTNTITVAIPMRLPAGMHSVQATMNETMSGTQAVHIGGKCPAVVGGSGSSNCAINAQYSSQFTYAKIWDATTNTLLGVTSNNPYGPNFYNYTYDYNRTTCSSGTCTYSNYSAVVSTFPGNTVSTVFTAYFNYTFNHTHRYWVELGIYIEATEFIQGYPNSSASATINMATFGNLFGVGPIKVV